MNRFRDWAKSKAVQAAALGLASGLLVLGAQRLGWLETAGRKSLDWRFRALSQTGRANRDIVIVALDDTSFASRDMLDNFGRWPWRRKLYAGLINYLNECGVRAIGVDIVFQGADPHEGDDAQFAVALNERRNVVLACALNLSTFLETDPTAQEKVRHRLAPLAAGTLSFTGSTLTRFATEGREKRRYRKTLLKYLSPQLVQTIMQDFAWESLRGEKRHLTVLFSDIRGFTSISEKIAPEAVVKILNEHLNMMVSVVFKNHGTLDKFVGDCVMAYWGAPLPQPNHAARAALEMIEGLEKLNQKWQSEGRPTLKIGVGISTGEMLFGNIGSEQRMDCTVIGDSVNLGSRLEGATKDLHATIVISEATCQSIRDMATVRPLGEITVYEDRH